MPVFRLPRPRQCAGAEATVESAVVIVRQSLEWFVDVKRRKEREDTRAAREMNLEGKRGREPKLW